MAVLDEATLLNWFTYHSPTAEDLPKYVAIRDAGLAFAKVLVDNTPASADQTAAVRHIRTAVMFGNASIACGGV
jgi:hypothetical protein